MARPANAEYWAQRMKIMEDALKDQGYAYVENLKRQFARAQAEIEKQIAAWYQRFAANNSISLADAKRWLTGREMEEFRWTVGEYIAYGQQNALDGAWMRQLENASARVHISRLEALKLQIQQQAEALYGNQLDAVDTAVRELYLGSYYHTAFEIQRGLGVGWPIVALNENAVQKVLSRPWTADNLTFRDHCWTNKHALVSSVNTQLTQMIIRGEAPDAAIKAIAHQFQVSRGKAGRLVMTESAAFASAAQKDCYRDLDVERFQVVATFDKDTCELCGDLDGQVFPMSEYEAGLTAPPFHPWCRCCTAPYFEDMARLGERWTRNPDGSTGKVPRDMSFEAWREKFVQGPEAKNTPAELFRPMGDYLKPDGRFDLDTALADYEKFLQTVPEKNRMYLQQAAVAVEYEQRQLKRSPFGYSAEKDAILYDPVHPAFAGYDFSIVLTHELAHRIDHTMFIQSWENTELSNAIAEAKSIIDAAPKKFLACAEKDADGFLSDILSAISEQDYKFPINHDKSYWLKPGNKEKEIFANLFSLEAFGRKDQLQILKDYFPDIMDAYGSFWK